MNHEAGEKKADQQWRSEVHSTLVVRSRLRECEEEEEASNEEGRVVGDHDGERHEQELHDRDPRRHGRLRLGRFFSRGALRVIQSVKFPPKEEIVERRCCDDSDDGFPAEVK
jgi:hypothetical protein